MRCKVFDVDGDLRIRETVIDGGREGAWLRTKHDALGRLATVEREEEVKCLA